MPTKKKDAPIRSLEELAKKYRWQPAEAGSRRAGTRQSPEEFGVELAQKSYQQLKERLSQE